MDSDLWTFCYFGQVEKANWARSAQGGQIMFTLSLASVCRGLIARFFETRICFRGTESKMHYVFEKWLAEKPISGYFCRRDGARKKEAWAGDWRLLNYPDNWRRLGPIYINYSDIGGRKRCKFSLSSDWRCLRRRSSPCYPKVCLRHTQKRRSCDLFPDRCSCWSCLLLFLRIFFLISESGREKEKNSSCRLLVVRRKVELKAALHCKGTNLMIHTICITYLFHGSLTAWGASSSFSFWKQQQIAIISLTKCNSTIRGNRFPLKVKVPPVQTAFSG